MTAPEIRSMHNLWKDGNNVGSDGARDFLLIEIAAQLADLNAHLADGERPIAVALCASNDIIPVIIQER